MLKRGRKFGKREMPGGIAEKYVTTEERIEIAGNIMEGIIALGNYAHKTGQVNRPAEELVRARNVLRRIFEIVLPDQNWERTVREVVDGLPCACPCCKDKPA